MKLVLEVEFKDEVILLLDDTLETLPWGCLHISTSTDAFNEFTFEYHVGVIGIAKGNGDITMQGVLEE